MAVEPDGPPQPDNATSIAIEIVLNQVCMRSLRQGRTAYVENSEGDVGQFMSP
jgi:hypothetical protein